MPKQVRTLTRAGAVVAPATMLANLLGYGFNLAASRALGPADYGAVAALLGLLLVGLVPALALQNVVARHTALHAAGSSVLDVVAAGGAAGADDAGDADMVAVTVEAQHALSRALLRVAAAGALLVAGATALLTPVATPFLHLGSPWPYLWMAASLAPLTLTAAVAGIFQGGEHFGRLALVTLLPPVARLGGGGVALMLDARVTGVIAGTAAGSVVTLAVALALVRPALALRHPVRAPRVVGELVAASQALLGLLALANLDLVLARHYLTAHGAGLYAAGNLVSRAAFWLPQAVPIIVFARLTDATRRAGVLRWAAAAVLVAGGAMTLFLGVAGTWTLRLLLGESYAGIGPLAWAFAAQGTGLALVQLLLYSDIAVRAAGMGRAVWAVVAAEAAVVATVAHGSAGRILGTALAGSVCLVALGVVRRRPPTLTWRRPGPVLTRPTRR